MRESGILLHISSLPNSYGIGTLGKEAYEFVDFLNKSHQSYWQVLPIGPTSYGDSPYQTFSAFAGNPYFIDLDLLVKDKLLLKKEVLPLKDNSPTVDYEKLYNTRFIVLKKAYKRFISKSNNEEYEAFKRNNNFWLYDYAMFMTLKEKNSEGNWLNWDIQLKIRNKKALNQFWKDNKIEIEFWMFIQFIFFTQWNKLKEYANCKNVKIIGDMPIYVALDSSDVWSNPSNWLLDENLNPVVVAGVPPDYFSRTGQLWGNPIYNYERMKKDNYSWWITRIKEAFKLFDVVRIDHFRGFESYYSIPAKDKTAEFGRWEKGPGISLFKKINSRLGHLDIIAEDLGFLTPEVHQMLKESGYPGMKILQFGFDLNDDSDYLPHNYPQNSICYTGTHDNMTLKEWLATLTMEEKEFVFEYANISKESEAINKLIKCILGSASNRAIIPLSDYLELGEEGRFNIPSKLGGNWVWRLQKNQLTDKIAKRMALNTKTYRRC